MSHYKTVRLDPDQFQMISGKSKHEIELPFAEDCDLWLDFKASEELTVWLYFGDGKTMPYARGYNGHYSIRTQNLLSIVFTCSPKTVITVCVSYKDLARREKADWTPVEITPPEPAQLALAQAVQREMLRLGVLTGGDETIEVDEEDNLEEDDEEGEFGEGYMEMGEEVPLPRARGRGPKVAPATEPGPSDHDGGDSPKPDSGPVSG